MAVPKRISPTFLPYKYLATANGGSVQLVDSNGEPISLASTEVLLTLILGELTAIRMMLSESSGISIDTDEIINLAEETKDGS